MILLNRDRCFWKKTGWDVISVLGPDCDWLESSAAGTRLMGYPKGFAPEGGILSLVHPDDRDYWKSVVSEAIQNAGDFEMEYRIVWPDQSIHWIYVLGGCTQMAGGKTAMRFIIAPSTLLRCRCGMRAWCLRINATASPPR